MQKAVPVGVGAMAALLGIELEPAQEACKEAAQGEVVAVANDNGGGQVVVSGHKAAVERAIETAKPRGAKRGMLLPVSAPFHCPLMQPAADAMRDALEKVTLETPRVPLVANVLASEVTNPEAIKQRLVEQVTGHGALARERAVHEVARRRRRWSSAAPARCCPAWSSASTAR